MSTSMVSLRSDIVKRVRRLPKPKNVASALQPLFEAVSNAIHSTQAKFPVSVARDGRVSVIVLTDRKKENVQITVEDNGLGLDQTNWNAFTTTDTDNKIEIGGKGVGRLLWLDCFEEINISSVFQDGDELNRRAFQFVLHPDNQIQDLSVELVSDPRDTMFHVHFKGLQENEYQQKFPGRGNFVFQHFTSHFLPVFIGDQCPILSVTVNDETQTYPDAIDDLVHRRESEIIPDTEKYGTMTLTLMECDKVASADLSGMHFVHFIAHDRAVHSQRIDNKLGLKHFGPNHDLVFHAILTGSYLDENVNQERTAFQFQDAEIERIINGVCMEAIEHFLEAPLTTLRTEQQRRIEQITQTYPSVAFGVAEELQKKVPTGELSEDAIYGHLARERYRRDERQAEKIRAVLRGLRGETVDAESFTASVKAAGEAIEEAEQRSLTEYIVRRKVVLDFVERLLEKVRDDTRDSAYQTEDILHSFICPLRISTTGGGQSKVEPAASHDLWIVDERLTFARYFSSDVGFNRLSERMESEERPDLLIFDHVHGLRSAEGASRVLLVEFKRPGRTSYGDDENPQLQVERYVRQLQAGGLADVRGRPIRLDESTVFYCFIVADIVGKLDEWTFSWQRTVDGSGRIYRPIDGFRGSIELFGWDDLLGDARARNQAFFDEVGITGRSFFSPDE